MCFVFQFLLRINQLQAVTCMHVCMRPYLHLPYSHAILREHSQSGVCPPRPHHVHGQAAVIELFFRLQERVTIQPDVSLQNTSAYVLVFSSREVDVSDQNAAKQIRKTI